MDPENISLTISEEQPISLIIADSARGPIGPIGPIGPAGPVGPASFIVKGSVSSYANLPSSNRSVGDLYVITGTVDNGIGYTWTGSTWNSVGLIRGPIGATGSIGATPNISIGTTTVGDARVTLSGSPPNPILNFRVPKGETGANGSAATISVHSVTTGAAGTDASVTNFGNANAAAFDFVIPRGNKGDTGNAATITVGATNTGPENTSALVTNTGTPNAAILNFTIPKGIKGDTGPQGTGITIKGTKTAVNLLPTTGNTTGDLWVITEGEFAGDGYIWNGTASPPAFVNAGHMTGPAGQQGPVGPSPVFTIGAVNEGTAAVSLTGNPANPILNFTVPKGEAGTDGTNGAKGDAATIVINSVTSGTTTSVSNSGTVSAAKLDFVLQKGDQGIQGPIGPSGTITSATATTGAAGSNVLLDLGGIPSARTLAFTIPRGDTGPAGTITSVTATTGAAGTSASVAVTGTPSASALAFTIPRGDTGTNGTNGTNGTDGKGYGGLTSATSFILATGSKEFATNINPYTTAYVVGNRVRLINSATIYAEGYITSMASGPPYPRVVVNIDKISGSGEILSWTFSLVGEVGPNLISSSTTTSLPTGNIYSNGSTLISNSIVTGCIRSTTSTATVLPTSPANSYADLAITSTGPVNALNMDSSSQTTLRLKNTSGVSRTFLVTFSASMTVTGTASVRVGTRLITTSPSLVTQMSIPSIGFNSAYTSVSCSEIIVLDHNGYATIQVANTSSTTATSVAYTHCSLTAVAIN